MAKILIADDEKDVLELVSFILEREGHTVFDVSDGQAALETAEIEKPDLIILDIMMPKVDGYSVASRLRESQTVSNVPVIILTAKSQVKDLFKSLSNVVDYIEKPFTPAVVKSSVKEALKNKK